MSELKYNEVIAQLMEPFQDSEISEREGAGGKVFSYVSPEKYRKRLHVAFPGGFELYMDNYQWLERGVFAICHFKADSPEGCAYNIAFGVFEPYGYDREGKIFGEDQMYQKLKSAGVKSVGTELGLGLHLYDKAARKVSGNGASSNSNGSAPRSSSNGSSSAGYDREANVGFGKHKDVAWKDVPDDYLDWLANSNGKNSPTAIAEIAFRSANNAATGAAQGASAARPASSTKGDDYDQIPF